MSKITYGSWYMNRTWEKFEISKLFEYYSFVSYSFLVILQHITETCKWAKYMIMLGVELIIFLCNCKPRKRAYEQSGKLCTILNCLYCKLIFLWLFGEFSGLPYDFCKRFSASIRMDSKCMISLSCRNLSLANAFVFSDTYFCIPIWAFGCAQPSDIRV